MRFLPLLLAASATLVLGPRARAEPDAGAPPIAQEIAQGPSVELVPRPSWAGEVRACSFSHLLCVHAPARTDPPRILAVLASAERALHAWSALGFPAPDADPDSGAFDVYLVAGATEGARAELAARDPIASFDRASSFLLVDPRLSGCALDTAIARETARAILWRTAPSTDRSTALAETSYLARLVVPCALEAPDGVDLYQSHPELAVTAASAGDEYARGAALFYWWLDYAFGNTPGGVVQALWALAPTSTPPFAPRWAGRPDGLDVLRASFKGALTSGSSIDDLWLDFAVARWFVGAGSDADHMPETAALGAAGQPRAEWSIGWPTTPRKLVSGRGVEPTGAAYVAVDCGDAPHGARLRFEAEWEEHARMRWAAVKVDAAGHERGDVAIPGQDRGTAVQFTVVDLDGASRVLFVGTNLGDPAVPYDFNDEAPEPHGWMVSVAAEAP